MGTQQTYIESGGFSQYLYKSHDGFNTIEINGVRGKMIVDQRDPDGEHYSLSSYANTSDMYFKIDNNGNVIQGRLYIDRKSVLDFDWDHSHTNKKTGESFLKGTVHVQEYYVNNKGELRRNSKARLMTEEEIKKYGPLIHAFNPNVKFR